jgi:hypothetical protein
MGSYFSVCSPLTSARQIALPSVQRKVRVLPILNGASHRVKNVVASQSTVKEATPVDSRENVLLRECAYWCACARYYCGATVNDAVNGF